MRELVFHGAGRQPFHLPALVLLILIMAAGLALPATAGQRLTDTDLPGGDYREFSLISPLPDFCEKVCAKDTRCKAWTFAWPGKRGKRAKCILKESVPAAKKDTCCISGIKDGAGTSPTQTAEAPAHPGAGNGEAGSGSGMDDGRTASPDTGNETTAASPAPAPQPAPQDDTADTTPEPSAQDAEAEQNRQMAEATSPPAEPDMTEAERLALAEKRRFCEAYAEAAMRANALNRQLGCGYTGGRWGASYRGYFNWCMRNPRERAEANTRARERLIAQCRAAPPMTTPGPEPVDDDPFGGPPVPDMADLESCTLYARISQRQAERAQQLRCGYFGPEWKTSFGAHFAQCRQMTVAQRRRQIQARRAALKRCESDLPSPVERPARERGRMMGSAPFLYQWVQVRGPGRWRSGWRPSVSGKCPLVNACDCGPETCGVYPPGATALMWPRGCAARPVVIQCRVRRNR